ATNNGQALFLGTDPDSVAHKLYLQHGFRDVNTAGHMAWYARGQTDFESAWFVGKSPEIEQLNWRHWPAATPLFLQSGPGIVRCAPLRMFWSDLVEGPLLPAIETEMKRLAQGQAPAAVVLKYGPTGAVLGMALRQRDQIWPATFTVDVFCHQDYWSRAGDLLDALHLPAGETHVAFGDASCPAKIDALKNAGFAQVAVLPKRIAADRGQIDMADIIQMEKS
ncbi:MAG: hypothetical protein WCN95_12270, partial [bacterium]